MPATYSIQISARSRQPIRRWTGMPATYSNLKRNLTSGSGATFSRAKHPGRNLYMLPGGVAEIFTAQPARCSWLCAEGRASPHTSA